MATFPKLIGFLNPWKKKVVFHQTSTETAPTATEGAMVEDFNREEVFGKINSTTALEVATVTKQWADSGMKLEVIKKMFTPIVAAIEKGEKLDAEGKVKILKEWADVKGAIDTNKDPAVIERERSELIETAELLYQQVEDKLELLENHTEYKAGYIFMKKGRVKAGEEADRVNAGNKDNEFKKDASYTIDYGKTVDPVLGKKRENSVRLDQMIPSDVTQIQVVSLKYKETVTLYRCEDGKYRKDVKSKDHHYYVFEGDQVTIKERTSLPAAPAILTAEKAAAAPAPVIEGVKETPTAEALQVAAIERQNTSAAEKIKLEGDLMEGAIGTRVVDEKTGEVSSETYGQLGDGVSRTLDESLTGWTAEDFDRNFDQMAYGAAVQEGLARMARAGGKSSGMELWADIYNGEGKNKPDEIYSSEVALAAMGQDNFNLKIDYYKLTDPHDGEIVYLKEQIAEEIEKKATTESDENREKRIDARIDNLKKQQITATPKRKEHLQERIDDLEASKSNDRQAKLEAKLSAAQARKTQIEEYYKGAMIFMAALPHLSMDPAQKVTAQRESDKSGPEVADLAEVEKVCSLLFDAKNEGPVVKPSFWEGLFKGEKKHTLSMGLNEGRTKDEQDFFQEKVSEKGAWIMLEQMGITHNERGEVIVDKIAFLDAVNQLMALGKPYLSLDPEWTDEANRYLPDSPKFANWEEMTKALTTNPKVIGRSDEEYLRRFNHTPKETYRELIRYGMGAKMGLELAKNEADEAKYQEALSNLNVPAPKGGEQAMIERAEKLAGSNLTAEQRAEIASNVHQYYLATLTILRHNQEGGGRTGFGIDLQTKEIVLCKEPRLILHAGVLGNVYTEKIEFHAGADLAVVKTDSFELHLVGGVNGSALNNVNTGLGVQSNIEMNNPAYSLNLGAGTTLTPIGLAVALNIGVDRDVAQVLVQKTDALVGEKKDEFQQEMELTKTVLRQTMNEAEVAIVEKQLHALFVQQMTDQATDNLKTFQFLGAGVVYITPTPVFPLGLALPYVKVGLKGKEYTVYKGSDVNMDSVLQQRINEQVAKQSRSTAIVEISNGGSTLLNANGERILGQVEVAPIADAGGLKEANKILAEQFLNLESVTLSNGIPALRLKVGKVDGTVNIWSDPKSGIKTYAENGQIYIVASPGKNLHFTRTDEYTGFRDGNDYHKVGIFISENPNVPLSLIKEDSQSHLSYHANLEGNVTKDSMREVKDRGTIAQDEMTSNVDGSKRTVTYADYREQIKDDRVEYGSVLEDPTKMAIYRTLEEMTTSGVDLGAEDTKSTQARERLSKVMEQEAKSADLSSARKGEIEAHAKEIMADPTSRRSYKELSLGGANEAVASMVKTSYPSETWTPKAMTYMIQALMVESLSTASSAEVTDWNKQALVKILVGRMSPDEADKLSDKMMTYFNAHMSEATDITQGSILQILVGTENIEGYREASWTGEGKLKASVSFPEGLAAMDLSNQEMAIVNDLMTERMAPLPESNPEEMLRSQIGLHVLEYAPDIFNGDAALKVADLRDKVLGGSIHDKEQIPADLLPTYNSLVTLITHLRKYGHYENSNVSLTVKTEKRLGLFDKCQNFSSLINEKVEKVVKGRTISAGGAEGYNTLTGATQADVIGAGVQGGLTYTPEEVVVGEKESPATQGTGSRPIDGSGRPNSTGTESGTGATSGAAALQDE